MKLVTELRRRRKDNRLIVGLLLAVLVVWSVVSVLEHRANEMEPVTITRGLLLFVLSYINITLIAAVLFVLCRVLLKTWLERRRDVLGSRFQTKLLVTYIGLTAIPIGLLFFTATGLLQRSIDRWFSTPVREVVVRARAVQDMAEKRIVDETDEKARGLAALAPDPADATRLAEFRRREKLDSVEAYRGGRRVALDAETPAAVEPVPAESLRKAETNGREIKIEALPDASHRYRALLRAGDTVWAAGTRIGPAEARALDAITAAWSDYKKLEAQKPAIKAANISTFLLIRLAILFASIWTGSTLARRITDPIAALAESTRRLHSGDLSARVGVPASDELGVLVDSFNRMAAGLQEARDTQLRSNEELQSSNRRLDLEKQLLSTVLESVTTGVLAFDAEGRVTVCNPAARALLSLEGEVTAETLRGRRDLDPVVTLLDEARTRASSPAARGVTLPSPEGERRL
jgi:nitrogen fixation/metabolism regulation signal transduction histidine kinase